MDIEDKFRQLQKIILLRFISIGNSKNENLY